MGHGLRLLGSAGALSGDLTDHRVQPELHELVQEIIADGAARRALRDDLPPGLAAHLITLQLAGTVTWWLGQDETDLRPLLDTVVRQVLHGVEDEAE